MGPKLNDKPIGSKALVYLPTCTLKLSTKCRYIYHCQIGFYQTFTAVVQTFDGSLQALLRHCLDRGFLEKDDQTTHRKINIEPENDGLEDDFPFPGVYSHVPC